MLPGWQRITLAGKPVDLFTPDSPKHTLLFLHAVGLESLADNSAYTAALAKYRAVCYAPQAGQSWWADRLTTEFDPAITPEQFLLKELAPLAPRIGVFGISMGGQGAIRLGFKYPTKFPVVAGVASAFDYHEWYGQGFTLDTMYRSKEACRQDTAILHVNGTHYPPHIAFACDSTDADWFRGNDRLHEKLSALGIPHTADLTTEAGGHSWSYFDAMADWCVGFLVNGLTQVERTVTLL